MKWRDALWFASRIRSEDKAERQDRFFHLEQPDGDVDVLTAQDALRTYDVPESDPVLARVVSYVHANTNPTEFFAGLIREKHLEVRVPGIHHVFYTDTESIWKDGWKVGKRFVGGTDIKRVPEEPAPRSWGNRKERSVPCRDVPVPADHIGPYTEGLLKTLQEQQGMVENRLVGFTEPRMRIVGSFRSSGRHAREVTARIYGSSRGLVAVASGPTPQEKAILEQTGILLAGVSPFVDPDRFLGAAEDAGYARDTQTLHDIPGWNHLSYFTPAPYPVPALLLNS